MDCFTEGFQIEKAQSLDLVFCNGVVDGMEFINNFMQTKWRSF